MELKQGARLPGHSAAESEQAVASRFPRFAGEGGRRWRPGCQHHTRAAGWAVSYVQFTTEKDGGWAGVSARSKASDSRQGQSTSPKKRPYNGPLN